MWFILFQSHHPYTLLNYQEIHNFPPSPINIYLFSKLLIHVAFPTCIDGATNIYKRIVHAINIVHTEGATICQTFLGT